MGPRSRPPAAIACACLLAALACSLPQRILEPAKQVEPGSPDEPTDSSSPLPGGGGEGEEQPGIADSLSGVPTSPAYDIYVGANVTGNCGPFTNSGGFAALTFDSVFRGIRFSPPSDANPMGPYGGILQEGGVAIPVVGMGLLGAGELGAFSFCPMYEPEAHTCTVTEGPSPFEPSLKIVPGETGIPVVPLVGTPVPGGGGEAILIYSIGAASGLSPIMMWDCEIGIGALGGSLNPVQLAFSTSWDRLMLGEEFDLGAISGDEGQNWAWTIRFVPVK